MRAADVPHTEAAPASHCRRLAEDFQKAEGMDLRKDRQALQVRLPGLERQRVDRPADGCSSCRHAYANYPAKWPMRASSARQPSRPPPPPCSA